MVLGLIFLEYISDRFAQTRTEIHAEGLAGGNGADPEDRDEYTAEGVFWVPASARWHVVQAAAKQTNIGKRIDDAMTEIEKENPRLKGILSKGYARPTLDQRCLGEPVDLIGTMGLGTAEHQVRDTLGWVYEYFLGMFASTEGKRGGEFCTPASVVCPGDHVGPLQGAHLWPLLRVRRYDRPVQKVHRMASSPNKTDRASCICPDDT
ncbi:type I restriction-modification system subunit M N-terminal domain-containing protein, partial [Acidithiobacillus sp.]|uniref:type I restriction-modification system subunit M N-terminal domain-containing protein n=1 Tax=Acidithiobacillus sp. TaxID=1872118 RepID=UPI0025BF0239